MSCFGRGNTSSLDFPSCHVLEFDLGSFDRLFYPSLQPSRIWIWFLSSCSSFSSMAISSLHPIVEAQTEPTSLPWKRGSSLGGFRKLLIQIDRLEPPVVRVSGAIVISQERNSQCQAGLETSVSPSRAGSRRQSSAPAPNLPTGRSFDWRPCWSAQPRPRAILVSSLLEETSAPCRLLTDPAATRPASSPRYIF